MHLLTRHFEFHFEKRGDALIDKARLLELGEQFEVQIAKDRGRNTAFVRALCGGFRKVAPVFRGSPPDIITLWIESFEGQLTDSLLTETGSQSNASNGRRRDGRQAIHGRQVIGHCCRWR